MILNLLFLNPHVAVAHGVAVVLEPDRSGRSPFLLAGTRLIFERIIIVDQDAVKLGGDAGRGGAFAIRIKLGSGKIHIIGLPGERWETGVYIRILLLIEAAAIILGGRHLDAEGIEHLQLITALEVEAAIAAGLAAGSGLEGESEFHMQFEALEFILGNGTFLHQPILGDL